MVLNFYEFKMDKEREECQLLAGINQGFSSILQNNRCANLKLFFNFEIMAAYSLTDTYLESLATFDLAQQNFKLH